MPFSVPPSLICSVVVAVSSSHVWSSVSVSPCKLAATPSLSSSSVVSSPVSVLVSSRHVSPCTSPNVRRSGFVELLSQDTNGLSPLVSCLLQSSTTPPSTVMTTPHGVSPLPFNSFGPSSSRLVCSTSLRSVFFAFNYSSSILIIFSNF